MSKLAHSNQETMDEIELNALLMDKEATQFAFELLMPEDLVCDYLKQVKPFDFENDKAIKKMADKFKVPVNALMIRLGQLQGVTI